jgi:hypothetical protein
MASIIWLRFGSSSFETKKTLRPFGPVQRFQNGGPAHFVNECSDVILSPCDEAARAYVGRKLLQVELARSPRQSLRVVDHEYPLPGRHLPEHDPDIDGPGAVVKILHRVVPKHEDVEVFECDALRLFG